MFGAIRMRLDDDRVHRSYAPRVMKSNVSDEFDFSVTEDMSAEAQGGCLIMLRLKHDFNIRNFYDVLL